MKINISHEIEIDDCIGNEIAELNYKHGVFTLYSCCGHGKKGNIMVKGANDIKKMEALGYKKLIMKRYLITIYPDGNDNITWNNGEMFEPKSNCLCKNNKFSNKKKKKLKGNIIEVNKE